MIIVYCFLWELLEKNDFDFLLVSETSLSDGGGSDVFKISNYRFFSIDWVGGGGGVAAYVKDSDNIEIVNLNFNTKEHLVFLKMKLKLITNCILRILETSFTEL